MSEPSSPPLGVKKALRQARKAAVLTAAATLCASCPGVKVRPEDDLAWLASCPAEARETVRLLRINAGAPNEEGPNRALLLKGPNVFPHESGCEVREGEVRAAGVLSPAEAGGTLIGVAREGSDRVSFRFTELLLADGNRFPICAIGAEDFLSWGPCGSASRQRTVPVRLAPYLGQPRLGRGANVN